MKFSVLVETAEENRAKDVGKDPEIRKAWKIHDDAAYLVCEGSCPNCGDHLAPHNGFDFQGDINSKVMLNDHDFVCVAFCVACRKPFGTLKVEHQTIFGLEEDQRVLQGRPRVYG